MQCIFILTLSLTLTLNLITVVAETIHHRCRSFVLQRAQCAECVFEINEWSAVSYTLQCFLATVAYMPESWNCVQCLNGLFSQSKFSKDWRRFTCVWVFSLFLSFICSIYLPFNYYWQLQHSGIHRVSIKNS